jgi:hypothetical protein
MMFVYKKYEAWLPSIWGQPTVVRCIDIENEVQRIGFKWILGAECQRYTADVTRTCSATCAFQNKKIIYDFSVWIAARQ